MGTNRETTLPVAASATAASNVSADLDMRSARAASRSGHIVVEGEVRNTAVRRLSGLEVVVEVRTATGTLLTSDAFLVALPNLQPGASTPFRAILVDRREASRCILRFRTQCGDELRVNSCSPGG
jgi:hypothetical protein